MLNKKKYNIVIASLPDHDHLVAEIYDEALFIALVSQERGKGVFDLEIPGEEIIQEEVTRKVNLKEFIEALNQACARLQGEVRDL